MSGIVLFWSFSSISIKNYPHQPDTITQYSRLNRPDTITQYSRLNRPDSITQYSRLNQPDTITQYSRLNRPDSITQYSRLNQPDTITQYSRLNDWYSSSRLSYVLRKYWSCSSVRGSFVYSLLPWRWQCVGIIPSVLASLISTEIRSTIIQRWCTLRVILSSAWVFR